MAFKLTYRDGQQDDYDDTTAWAVEDGVLKMGYEADKWTVLVSPSHWATIEVQPEKSSDEDDKGDDSKAEERKKDEDKKSARKKRDDEKDTDKDSDDK